MKNRTDYKEWLILIAFIGAILLFPALIQVLNGVIYALWDVQPGIVVSNIIYLLPNLAMLFIAAWFIKLDGWNLKGLGANGRKILPGFLFAVLSLVGLYVILPIGTALFFEPHSLFVSARKIDVNYIVQFLSTWGIACICIAFMAWGYLLNKTYSVITISINPLWKKVISIILLSVVFTVLHVIRFKIANTTGIDLSTVLIVFSYCIFCSYLYVRTSNMYVAAFMQAAYAFPPLGLTVGGRLVVASFGFIFTSALVFSFVIILAETYSYWGKLLEFDRGEPTES